MPIIGSSLSPVCLALWRALGAVPPSPPPPPPPPPGGQVPDSPGMLETTGSLVGQMTVLFFKASFLQGADNVPITDDPITETVIYVSASWDNAEAGVYVYSGSAGTTETATINGIPPGTYYVYGVSSNSNGPSDKSHILVVTVT